MSTQRQQGDGSKPVDSTSMEPSEPQANRSRHDSLIAQVLEATLTGDRAELSEAEFESLAQVARAHPANAHLSLEIVCQLVSALLTSRFATLVQEQTTLHQMSLRIAGSLWTHPRSQQHLIRFWELLSSDVRK